MKNGHSEKRTAFWNKKILKWEESKYTSDPQIDFNSSIKFRRKIAVVTGGVLSLVTGQAL